MEDTEECALQLYSQSKGKSGGGECRVEAEDGAPRAEVFLSPAEVRETVLARQSHEIVLDNQTVKLRLSSGASSKNGSEVPVVTSICIKEDYSIVPSNPVKVYPYFESLSSALYGKERPSWKMPKPFTETVSYIIWKYLQEKKLIKSINDHMHKYYCNVNMDAFQAELTPLPNFLRQKDLTAQQVDAWESSARDAFRQHMSQYTVFECPANELAWKAAEAEVHSIIGGNVFLVFDGSRGFLTVAGGADDIKRIRAAVESIVLKAISQIEQQTIRVSDFVNLSPPMYFILQQVGLQKAAQDISPEMTLAYDKNSQKLTITGLVTEVSKTKTWILEQNVAMSKKQINVPLGILDFLRTVDPMDMSNHLFTSQGISSVFSVESKGVLLTGSSDRALTDAEEKMKEVLTVMDVDVEDKGILNLQSWNDLKQQLLDSYNSKKMKTVSIQDYPGREDKITVAGFQNPVNEVGHSLTDFIWKYSRTQESIRVKSVVVQFIEKKKSLEWSRIAKDNDVKVNLDPVKQRIFIEGARLHVQKAKLCFKDLTSSLFYDHLNVNKPETKQFFQSHELWFQTVLMSDFGCVVMLRPENQDEEEEENLKENNGVDYCKVRTTAGVHVSDEKSDICSFGMDRKSLKPSRKGRMEQTTAEGLKIVLLKGNIQDQTTHVIVNTTAKDMNLNRGAVSKAILQAAGPGLQTAVQSGGDVAVLGCGDVVTTDGFNLSCRKIFHVVCPAWDNGGGQAEETLASIIRYCLGEAENLRMGSLSFPAIGTGNLNFPRDVVSRVLLREIKTFSSRLSPQHLREVVIVVHPSDSKTVDCFTKVFSGQTQQSSASFSQVSSPSLGVHQMQMGSLTLEVSSGDITKETCDAIVNSSNNTFDLYSGVSKAILDSAGPQVQMECAQIAGGPNYQPSQMILTSAGLLPSRNIIHVVGSSDPMSIKDTVYSVLKFCEENRFNSVALPALGTGQGGADPSLVADAMVEAVVEFVRKKHPKLVKSVKILIFQTFMLTEFHKSMKKKEGEEVVEKNFFRKFKDAMTSFFSGPGEQRKSPANLVLETEQFEPAEFELCADNERAVTLAKKKIEELIVKKRAKKVIKDQYISQLSQGDMDELKDLQRTLTVSITLDRGQQGQEPTICVEGLARDVMIAEVSIRSIFQRVKIRVNLRSLLMSTVVQWQSQHPKGKMVAFDLLTNLKLEEAFKNQQPVQIQINNKPYVADAQLKKAVSLKGHKMVELLRKDLKEDNSSLLPQHWDDMKSDLLKLIPLNPGDKEYSGVEKRLTKTGLRTTIIKIERVQNPTLWQSYQLKKEQLEKKNKHKNNERRLFHGTQADCIDLINQHGFNRSHAGKHAAMYGNGSYFAVDPYYSASVSYATPDPSGLKRMYLARVLVGDFTQGASGMIMPPAKNSGNVSDLYDSVTDNTANPTMFVVFNDMHAYPEYLITFI